MWKDRVQVWFAVTVTSNVAKCRDRGFERGEAMREIVRIIARIMRKKRARRRSKNSTTVFKKQGRFTRYTSVRVTTMHSNDSNLSGNYFDSTCICIVEENEIHLSFSLSLQAFLNEASVEGGTTLLRYLASYVSSRPSKEEREDSTRFSTIPRGTWFRGSWLF